MRELVAFDRTGTHLFRLRADVWGDDGLDRVVDALGVQVVEERGRSPPGTSRSATRRAAPGTSSGRRSCSSAASSCWSSAGLLAVEFAGLNAP